MIDELDFAGPEHLDPAFVTGYEQKQGNPDPTADLDVLAAHGVGLTSTVVDLGAGTGIFALAAARRFGHVIAVDVSPAMLRVVRERATAAGLENLDCIQAGFLSYQHAGAPVDAVFTRNALHHLPDFWKGLALVRMAAMMRTGGVMRLHDIIYDFQALEAETVLAGWLDGASADPARGYTREDFATHIEMNTARSGGCWNRCWCQVASKSRRQPSEVPFTARIRASSAESGCQM
jgi:SAM-dependent methyltransferase